MNDTYRKNLKQIKALIQKIEYKKSTIDSILYWDKLLMMPPDGAQYRSDVMAYLGEELYTQFNSLDLQNLINYFDKNEHNDFQTNSMIKKLQRNSKYINAIPRDTYINYIQLIAKSEQVWQQAVEANDYIKFKPYLESLIAEYQKIADYWGYKNDPYDAWIDYHEPGLSTEILDSIIKDLKPALLSLLKKIKSTENIISKDPFSDINNVSVNVQLTLIKSLLNDIGFNFKKGRIDQGTYTTILSNSPNDVRLITHIAPKDLQQNTLNALYIGGKGLYEQGIDNNLTATFLASAPSFAMEEAIGKLYENIIGKSQAFWTYVYSRVPHDILKATELQPYDFFVKSNSINISPIRLESDELTNMIHIIIRYEIERDLINKKLSVDDLPEEWNNKHYKYLGIMPKTHKEGVLQDIHWAAGYFGYLPTYILANGISAQLAASISSDGINLDSKILEEELDETKKWLNSNIYRYGSIYSTSELLLNSTGESLNIKHYTDYLFKRYTKVYKLT